MSGPKGFSYSVVSAEELRRREDEACSARCQQLAATLAGLVDQLRRLDAVTPSEVQEPPTPTHESLIAWEAGLRSAIAAAERNVREASAKAFVRRLHASDAAVDVTGIGLGRSREQTRASTPGNTTSDERRQLAAEVDLVGQLVSGLTDPTLRDGFAESAEKVLRTASPAQAKGDLLTLKTKLNDALRSQAFRQAAAEAVLEIAHVDSDRAQRLRTAAADVGSAKELARLRSEVTAVAALATQTADGEFVQAAVEEVLRELGFSLGEGFELTDFGGVGVAEREDQPGYGLRLQVNPEHGLLFTRLVSEHDSSPQEDLRAEAAICPEVHVMAAGLRQHGVATQLRTQRQPGERPVERVGVGEARSTPSPKRHKKRPAGGQERTR